MTYAQAAYRYSSLSIERALKRSAKRCPKRMCFALNDWA
jgi:hypothetical protein